MSVRISMTRFDGAGMAARDGAARQTALGIVAAQVLADATRYVPMSMQDRGGGSLRKSGRYLPVNDSTAEVEWGGNGKTVRYARAQHRGTNGRVVFRNYTTTGTGADWTGVAERARADAWRRMFAQEYARRLHG